MSATRSVEMTGESIEEAIQSGLEELAVSRGNVIVEILEEPSKGILGLGARQARVRLTTVARPQPPAPPPPAKRTSEPDDDDDESAARVFAPSVTRTIVSEADLTEEAKVGSEKLAKLLELMGIEAEVAVETTLDDTETDSTPILQVKGDALDNLIGRKGETLAAIQYVTRLMSSHHLQRRVNFVVDVGGYKAKRSETLSRLAMRMADQAVERHRTVKLEPMPPHERRIIHMALRQRSDVTTRSIGEGDYRKVTIIPR